MRCVSINMALCDRIVRHVDSLRGYIPQRFTNLVFALFGRRWTEIMMREKSKEIFLTEELKQSLRGLDAVILDILTCRDLPEDMSLRLYEDFSDLKTLIS